MKNALTALLKAHGKIDAAKHLDLLKIKCFSRDTLVHTATGPRPIGEIGPGEQIWSYHFERGVWGLCEVKERLDNTYSGPVVSITVDNTTIEATAYHPFWVIEGRDLRERSKPRELQEHEDEGQSLPGRWVNSHELRAGDCIITRSGTRALITEIRQRFDDAFPVSNLSIIGHHNYAVGEVGVLVHNESVCDETIADLRKSRANGASEDKIRDWLRSQTDKDGNRLYDDSEIDDAMGKVLAPEGPSQDALDRAAKKTLPPRSADEIAASRAQWLAKYGPKPNQMNQQIHRGAAPRTITRVDTPKIPGEQLHVHLEGGHALNIDGTWKHGGRALTAAEEAWLRSHNWPL
jgi:hypothetical protein